MKQTKTIKLLPALALALGALILGSVQARADGQSGTTLSAVVTGACGNGNSTFSGVITVTNGGGVATENLTITAQLTSPSGAIVYQTEPIDVSAHPVLQPGESYSYPYSFTLPKNATYKVTAYITITNHSGHLGTAYGPSPSSPSLGCGTPTAALLAHVSAARAGSFLVFHWRLAERSGVVGFNLYAGIHRLNARIISVHIGRTYSYRARWMSGPKTLHILRANGTPVIVPVS